MKTFKELRSELDEAAAVSSLMGGQPASFADKAKMIANSGKELTVSALRRLSLIGAGIQGYQSGKSDAKTNPNKSTGGFSGSILTGAGLGGAPGGIAGGLGYLAGKAINRSPNSDPRIGRWDNKSSVTAASPAAKPEVNTVKSLGTSSGQINVARNNPPRNADFPKPAPVTVSKPAVSKLVAAKPKTPSIVPPKPDDLKQQVGVTSRAVAGPTGTQFQNIARGSKPESGMFKKVGTAPSEPKNLAPQGSAERDTQLAKLGFKKF